MPDLLWDDVKTLFDPEINGTLPDAVIPGTTVNDWQALFDLLKSQGWKYAYSLGGGEPADLPSAAAVSAAHLSTGLTPAIEVWPIPEVLLIFRFYQTETIDFDPEPHAAIVSLETKAAPCITHRLRPSVPSSHTSRRATPDRCRQPHPQHLPRRHFELTILGIPFI